MTVDYPDWMPDAQLMLATELGITTQLAGLLASGQPGGTPGGIPLLTFKNVLAQASGTTVTTATPITVGPLTTNQTAYDFSIDCISASTTVTYLSIIFSWSDSATGRVTGRETYWVFPARSDSSAAHTIIGKGPTKGDTLSVQFTASGNNVTISYSIMATSRFYGRDYWQTLTPLTGGTTFASGLTTVTMDPSGLYLATTSDSVATGASVNYTLPLYVGSVGIFADTSSSTSDATCSILEQSEGANTTPKNPYLTRFATAGQGLVYTAPVGFGRSQLNLQLTNNNAATKTLVATIFALEQQVS